MKFSISNQCDANKCFVIWLFIDDICKKKNDCSISLMSAINEIELSSTVGCHYINSACLRG